jgi:hypothetical protein
MNTACSKMDVPIQQRRGVHPVMTIEIGGGAKIAGAACPSPAAVGATSWW